MDLDAAVLRLSGISSLDDIAHMPWAREVLFQTFHPVSCFLSLSNNLGNLLFARRTTPMAVSDRVLIQF
jgi:hypothetical protein